MTPRRGRPPGALTRRRSEVLLCIVNTPGRLSWSELARRCALYDHNEARRIVRDLVAMGLAPPIYSRIPRRSDQV